MQLIIPAYENILFARTIYIHELAEVMINEAVKPKAQDWLKHLFIETVVNIKCWENGTYRQFEVYAVTSHGNLSTIFKKAKKCIKGYSLDF